MRVVRGDGASLGLNLKDLYEMKGLGDEEGKFKSAIQLPICQI
jgi:hypothetical protein